MAPLTLVFKRFTDDTMSILAPVMLETVREPDWLMEFVSDALTALVACPGGLTVTVSPRVALNRIGVLSVAPLP